MGYTTVPNDTSLYNTNKSFYEYHLKGNWSKPYVVIDVAFCGSEIYELIKVEKEGKEEIFISLTVIKRYKGNANEMAEIGYKTDTEASGPCYYKCPKKFLRASTCTDKHAIDWRNHCLSLTSSEKRKKDKDMKIFYKSLQHGSVIEMLGGRKVVLCYHLSSSRFAAKQLNDEDQKIYGWKYKDIKSVVSQPLPEEVAA